MQKDEETMNIQPQIQQSQPEVQQPQPEPQIQPQPQIQQTQPVVSNDWYESRPDEYKEFNPQDYLTNIAAFRNYDSIEPALKPYNLNMDDYTWYSDTDDEGDYFYAGLKQALEEGDKEKVEEIVEEHPQESEDILQDGTSLDTEADEAVDGGEDKEVDNKAIEEAIDNPVEALNPQGVSDNEYYEMVNTLVSADFSSPEFDNAWDSFIDSIYAGDEQTKQDLLKIFSNPEVVSELPEDKQVQLGEISSHGILGDSDEFDKFVQESSVGDKSKINNEKEQLKLTKKLLASDNQEAWKDRINHLRFNTPKGGHYTDKVFGAHSHYVGGKSRVRKGYDKEMAKSILADLLSEEDWNDSTFRNNVLNHFKPYRGGYRLEDNVRQGLKEEIARETLNRKARGLSINGLSMSDLDKLRDNVADSTIINKIDAPEEIKNDIIKEQSFTESLIDWDKLEKEWEDTYYKNTHPEGEVKDEFGKDIPDFIPNDDEFKGQGAPGVLTHKDEDFAGPDELPAQIYDNSDFQPKQLPAVINDGLPSEQYYEPVYDTSGYNFDWSWEDITPEQVDEEVDEDEEIPEEDKEETKERRKRILKWAHHRIDATGGSSNAGSTYKPTYDKANGSMSFGSGKGIMSSASIGNFMANPKWNKPKQEPVKEVKSEASKAPEPVETVSKSSPIGVKSNPTTSNRTSNGGFNSGSVNKTGNSLIKVNKVSLPNGEANNQPDAVEGIGTSQTNNLRDSRIQLLEARIKQLDPELQEHFGFSTKYKHVEYKDTSLEECSGGQLQEIEEILEACGV